MPYIDIHANTDLSREKTAELKSEIARVLADSFPGKTENWLMLKFSGGEDMFSPDPPIPARWSTCRSSAPRPKRTTAK